MFFILSKQDRKMKKVLYNSVFCSPETRRFPNTIFEDIVHIYQLVSTFEEDVL